MAQPSPLEPFTPSNPTSASRNPLAPLPVVRLPLPGLIKLVARRTYLSVQQELFAGKVKGWKPSSVVDFWVSLHRSVLCDWIAPHPPPEDPPGDPPQAPTRHTSFSVRNHTCHPVRMLVVHACKCML